MTTPERVLSSYVPARSDRAFIAGQTGSGKTVLARYLCAFREHVVVFDPKRRIDWTGYKLVSSLKAMAALDPKKEKRIIFRPDFNAVKDWDRGDDEIQRAFEWVYRRGQTTLYVDEAYMLTRGEEIPDFYHACLTQGRELGVETWTATQRPMNIPQVLMSEAEHAYIFRLKLPQDRRKVEQICAVPESQTAALAKRSFLYAPQSGDTLGPFTLNLKRKSTPATTR
jgi:hypothetical protein